MEGFPKDAKDLVESLIVLNPNHRLTATEALEHQYVRRHKLQSSLIILIFKKININLPQFKLH